MGDPLLPLPMLVRLSRQMVTIIHQNILWFAFGVNIVGIVLTGWIMPAWSDEGRAQSPIWAAVYHQIGSLAVLLNAMRLLWFERTGPPFWQRIRSSLRSVDQSLERFNVHDASHWIIDHARPLLWGTVGLLLLLYLSTCLKAIPAGSVGVVQRCGRALDENLEPGLHVRLPWPWETVTIIEPDLVRRVEVGFRRAPNQSDLQTWTSSHSDNLLQDREEGLLITADGNLVEVQATLLYTLADHKKYLFRTSDINGLLRGEAEAALREIAAQRSFLQLLGGDRAAFQRDILQMLKQRLQRVDSFIGVKVAALVLEDLHPPQEVVKDYYEVTRALAARSRMITEAQADSEKNVSRETVNATRIQAEAQGDSAGKVTRAEADRDAFLDLTIAERWGNLLFFNPPPITGSPWTILPPLWPFAQPHDPELTTQMTLFRLTVEAGEQLLNMRPKVLRDPKIKGPLHVFPESLKLRLPTFGGSRERPPPNPELP
jgi:Cu+-exporting ATPase